MKKILVKIKEEWKEFDNYLALFRHLQEAKLVVKDLNESTIFVQDENKLDTEISYGVIEKADNVKFKEDVANYRLDLRNSVKLLEEQGVNLPTAEKNKLKIAFGFLDQK